MTASANLTRRSLVISAMTAGALAMAPSTNALEAPEAATQYGRVRGFLRNRASLFLGLPYGADTSGPRRFLPPAAPAPWSGVRDATVPGQRAPQVVGAPPPAIFSNYFTGGRFAERDAYHEPMGEDCLVLNVVTPAADRRRRPVMFYIHGGGFTTGSGLTMTLGDRFAVREDVVLVTVNHRLGALGYMYVGGVAPELAQGNPGMLDLVAALRWVRDNIAEFGGDPNKVTILGESGGAMKIGFLLAMPEAHGLFRAAIMQSGLEPEPLARDSAEAATESFMARNEVRDIEALRALPVHRFYAAGAPGSMPVADGRTLTAGMWAQAPASAARVPLLIGYCKDELTLFALGTPHLFQLQWSDVAASLTAMVALPEADAAAVVAAYRAAFPQDNPSDCYFRISSDATFGRAMVAIANSKAQQTPPVYFYRMEYDTGLPPGLRALHTAELPMTVDLAPASDAVALSRQISGAWAAFARTGNPNHAGLPRWRRYNSQRPNCMIFDLDTRSGPDPQAQPREVLYGSLAHTPQWSPLR